MRWQGTMRKSQLDKLKKGELNHIVTSGLIEEAEKQKLIQIVVSPHLAINGFKLSAKLEILV